MVWDIWVAEWGVEPVSPCSYLVFFLLDCHGPEWKFSASERGWSRGITGSQDPRSLHSSLETPWSPVDFEENIFS